jgi:hypothetical protein
MATGHDLPGRLVDEHDLAFGVRRETGEERVEGAVVRVAVLDPAQRPRRPLVPMLDPKPPLRRQVRFVHARSLLVARHRTPPAPRSAPLFRLIVVGTFELLRRMGYDGGVPASEQNRYPRRARMLGKPRGWRGAISTEGTMETNCEHGLAPGGVMDDGRLTIAEAAFEAGVSRQTVHDWIRRGHIGAETDANGALRLRLDDLHRLTELRRVATESGVRFATVRHWADDPDRDDAANAPE